VIIAPNSPREDPFADDVALPRRGSPCPGRVVDSGWLRTALARREAEAARSADTHLLRVPLPGLRGIDLYVKDESAHSTGSLKHRLARSLFLYGLCNGWIGPHITIVEASSGSTAVSEAYFAQMLGLAFVAVVPASTSAEKIAEIARYGGQSHMVAQSPEVYAEAAQIAATGNGHYIDQFTYAERATDWRGNNNIAQSIFDQLALERYLVPTWIVVGAGRAAHRRRSGAICATAVTPRACVWPIQRLRCSTDISPIRRRRRRTRSSSSRGSVAGGLNRLFFPVDHRVGRSGGCRQPRGRLRLVGEPGALLRRIDRDESLGRRGFDRQDGGARRDRIGIGLIMLVRHGTSLGGLGIFALVPAGPLRRPRRLCADGLRRRAPVRGHFTPPGLEPRRFGARHDCGQRSDRGPPSFGSVCRCHRLRPPANRSSTSGRRIPIRSGGALIRPARIAAPNPRA
jgi:hypothetical protein